ncbi:MAG: hypothetical protein HRJ53_25720 [Acidobacteria bacterium Pan2503]|uniref:Uncharacterized protein n=1 Tax=Candidatus Acidiferrum panamense TaxID=2741543 RepID=A0A7V8NVQ7_9BACT|nr:hypothetical protein [Candidatus Acidoferrum panamensis]
MGSLRRGVQEPARGRKAGEFFHLHSLSIDPKGNLITGESQGYRVQKFVYKGMAPVTKKDQGVVWPTSR